MTAVGHAHGGTPLLGLGYAYDALGRLTSRTDDQGTATFGYDDLDRLTSADFPGPGDYAYGYDAVGNITSVTSPSGTVARTHDAADRIADAGFVYDDAGALLTDGTRSFAYDALGRLTGVSGGGHAAAYLLDGDGHRVSQTVDSVTTALDLDLRGDLSSVLVAGDTTYLPGLQSLGHSDGTGWAATLADARGSVLAAVDAAGAMGPVARYDPYGGPRPGSTLPDGVGFAGEWADATGLVDLRARAYDPSLQRFLSRDALGGVPTIPATGNRHAYALGDPLRFADPSGHFVAALAPQPWDPPTVSEFLAMSEPEMRLFTLLRGSEADFLVHQFPDYVLGHPSVWHIYRQYLNFYDRDRLADDADEELFFGYEALQSQLDRSEPGSDAWTFAATTIIAFVGSSDIDTRSSGRVSGERVPRSARIIGAQCSFQGSTGVLMADGSVKAISEIEIGDLVATVDPETGERSTGAVTAVWSHEDEMVALRLEDGDVITTPDHPFWDVVDRQWERADTLGRDDLLLDASGSVVTVEGLVPGSLVADTAWNLTVSGLHVYLVVVGRDAVLVHNDCAAIKTAISRLPAGRGKAVSVVRSEAELNSLFERLSAGGTPVVWQRYNGQSFVLPDGTQVGLRRISSSTPGLPTIDIRYPDGLTWKVHVSK